MSVAIPLTIKKTRKEENHIMKNKTLFRLCLSAVIAALYAAVSLALAPISFGAVQVRVAEALTLLPVLFPEAIAGVTLGCFLTNLIGAMTGMNILGFADVLIGTLATFAAAVMTWKLRRIRVAGMPLCSALMPVLFNAVIIGGELAFVLFPDQLLTGFVINALQVGLGELLACLILGLPLVQVLNRTELARRFGLR